MHPSWFANVLVHHPYIVLSAVAVFSSTCILIPFTLKTINFPNFQDPQLGFSTRGTAISHRFTTWLNLVEATKPSGQFTSNPKDLILHRNQTLLPRKQKKSGKKNKKSKRKELKKIEYFGETQNYTDNTNADDKRKTWEKLRKLTNLSNENEENLHHEDGFFCGPPDERYAHVVLKSENKVDLFTVESLLTICRLELYFTRAKYYRGLCMEQPKPKKKKKCCKPWTLPNYIAILHNRNSCLSITEEDVMNTRSLLANCSEYFHNLRLSANCATEHCDVPSECTQHDAVFNILNFLTNISFLPNSSTQSAELFETMMFLPVAGSTAILPYYHEIEKVDLEYEGVKVVAMNFGIKNALFDECLIRDAWLMGSGAVFVFICMWLYTESLFLTVMTIIAIVFSMAISYFMYILVFEIKFFPFMNLLATVVAIGIGADDAFIFCKIWQIQKLESQSSIANIMTDTFQHAFLSIFVTSLTTSVAFLASYFSSVTAIACFSIFAGTAIVANHILMMTWFPASVVLWERSCLSNFSLVRACMMACVQRWCCSSIFKPKWNLSSTWPKCSYIGKFWRAKENILLDSVIKLKYLWLFLFFTLALASAIVVFYYPKLQLPDSKEFQLFDSSHLFEQYDFTYKEHFWYMRQGRAEESEYNFKLPLRFVWGVLPFDNGDYLDPTNLGTLTLDGDFDISQPEAQSWLLEFCQDLRQQAFFEPSPGLMLPNCFIETFIDSMQRKCVDSFTNKDRSPCCETATFPFNSSVFNECIIDEVDEVYRTPQQYLMPGMAGPKFSKDQEPTIKAIIVEYTSNYSYSMSYTYMRDFYEQVEKWMEKKLEDAPATMKNGWFVSELQFYDLQRELSESTQLSIALSMGLALIVLLLSTLNVLTSLYAIATITGSIFVAMAVLVLLGWKLNILESIAVSTAIGLTIDFSLHYSVNYRICPADMAQSRESATKYALTHMAGPALMAAVTTGAAGAFMIPSLILPYIQIGIFLLTVMCVSWLYATFFLGSLLATIGPQNRFGQFSYSAMICYLFRRSKAMTDRNRPSSSSVSDAHELDSLTYKFGVRPTPKALQRSSSNVGRCNSSKYVFTDQSPSATSAITIIMADDN